MIRRRGYLHLCIGLLALNLAFIWGNSLLPAELSQKLSDFVKALMEIPGRPESDVQTGIPLRKIAHFLEFMALGLNFTWLFLLLGQTGVHCISMPLLCGSMAACLDETIQIFSPGRSSSLVDVWIDIGGVAVGIMLLVLGHSIVRKHQKQHFGG